MGAAKLPDVMSSRNTCETSIQFLLADPTPRGVHNTSRCVHEIPALPWQPMCCVSAISPFEVSHFVTH